MWDVACKDRSGEGGVGEICHFDEAFDDEVDSCEKVKEQVAYTKTLDNFLDDVLAYIQELAEFRLVFRSRWEPVSAAPAVPLATGVAEKHFCNRK